MPSGDAPIIGRDPLIIHCSSSLENSGIAGIGSLSASRGNMPIFGFRRLDVMNDWEKFGDKDNVMYSLHGSIETDFHQYSSFHLFFFVVVMLSLII